MARDQDLVGRFAGQHQLAVGQMPRYERGVDDDFVLVFRKRLQLPVCQTESPGFLVVGGAIGDPIGMVGQCVAVLPELGE